MMKKIYSLVLALCLGLTANAFTPQITPSLHLADQLSSATRFLTPAPAIMANITEAQTVTMAADITTIQPKDTISILATNLKVGNMESVVGDVYGVAEASNDEYKVKFQFINPVEAGRYTNIDFLSGNPIINVLKKDTIKMKNIVATVSFENGRPIMITTVIGVDSILYQMDLRYELPEVTKTVNVDFTNVPTAKYLESGDYYIFNSNKEYAVQIDIFEEPNKLNGEYTVEDFYMYYTLVGEIANGDTTIYALADANAVVTPVSEGLVNLKAELLSEKGVLYKVNMNVNLPKIGLRYDTEKGSVDRTYSDDDIVQFETSYVAEYGELYLQIIAANYSDMLSLVFFVENTDKDITIPAGTYPIVDASDYGTAFSSVGYDEQYGPIPCFYSTLLTQGQQMYFKDLYFMVSGNIVAENVDGHLKLTIDALNSFDMPVHIVYEAVSTAVENVAVDTNSASKVIENNQLFIIKDGVKYNVLGAVVK